MELTHRFTVPAPVDQVWTSFNDLGSLLRCVPDVTLTSSGVFDFRGSVVVELGSESVSYNGSGSITERDETGHRVVIETADGRGGAAATVRAVLEPEGDGTVVALHTDLRTADPATRLDPGTVTRAADRLVDRFADCLKDRYRTDRPEADLGMVPPDHDAHSALDAMGHGGPADSEPVGTGDGPAGGGAQSGGASGVTAASSGTATPPGHLSEAWQPPQIEPRRSSGPAGLSELSTQASGRRYGPAAGLGAVALALIIRTIVRRRRRRR